MHSRPNARISRTIAAAIAALFAASLPAVAFAATDAPSDDAAQTAEAPKPVHKAKHARHHKAAKGPSAEAEKQGKHAKAARHDKAQAEASASPKGKKTRRTASRKKKGAVKASDAKAPSRRAARDAKAARRCVAPAVGVDRGGLEAESLSLTDCAGKPLAAAREKLSILARPWSAPRPDLAVIQRKARHVKDPAAELAPGVRLLDPGLLVRLEAIAKHFPGGGLSIVSGYRPQSRGSMHQVGRAIDLRVTSARNEDLVAFCRTLPDTGCGYYPNSSFVHVDVRDPGTGGTFWIDASGPGEPPRYVSEWPPKGEPKVVPPPVVPPADAVGEGSEAHGAEIGGVAVPPATTAPAGEDARAKKTRGTRAID